jgi:hypothetical protein
LEAKVKKAHLSPAASLAVSFSLVLGILVSGLSNHGLLPAAHAQSDSGSSHGSSGRIDEGVVLNGIAVRGLFVNGDVVEQGVIAGTIRVVHSKIVNGNGAGHGPQSNGALVGSGVSTSGALVGRVVTTCGARD